MSRSLHAERMTLVILGALVVSSAGCKPPAQAGAGATTNNGAAASAVTHDWQHLPRGLLDGPIPSATHGFTCASETVLALGVERDHPVCRAHAGDTAFFVILDSNDNVLVATRQYFVPVGVLSRVADSVEHVLTATHGRAQPCSPDNWFTGPTTERLRLWLTPQGSLRLKVDSLVVAGSRMYPNIGVQMARDTAACSRWIGLSGVM